MAKRKSVVISPKPSPRKAAAGFGALPGSEAASVAAVPAAIGAQPGAAAAAPDVGFLARTVYGAVYGLSYGVTLGALLIGKLVPGSATIARGLLDGAAAAQRALDRTGTPTGESAPSPHEPTLPA